MRHPGPVRIRTLERPREVTPCIDLGQEILDTDPWQGAFDGAAQVQDPRRELQRVTLFAVQSAAANRREVVGGEALGRLSRRRIKGVLETGAYAVTGSDDKTTRIWAAATGQLLRTIRLPQGPGHVGKVYAVAISPDGALVAAGGWTAAASPSTSSSAILGPSSGVSTAS
jgi:WD domain, G-beta repeat